MKGTIKEISYDVATRFLLPRHYSGRCPTISKAFGWYDNNTLKAVCTFGKPASPYLCDGVCGKEYSSNVYELNRLCRVDNWKEPLSMFVAYCLRQLKPLNLIIISYSDTAMNHHGYIYIKLVILFIQARLKNAQISMLQMVNIQDTILMKNKQVFVK